MNFELIRAAMPIPTGKTVVMYSQGKTDDIISEILATFQDSKQQTQTIAKYFRGKTEAETAKNIWNFLHSNINYKEDAEGWQYVKTPSRTIADKFGDCKAFSIFAASILFNLDIPFVFRFADYGENGGDVTHIYICIKNGTKEIPIDATIGRANYELPYIKKIDFSFDKDMAKIARVSGIRKKSKISGTADDNIILSDTEKTSGDWVRTFGDIFKIISGGVGTYVDLRDKLKNPADTYGGGYNNVGYNNPAGNTAAAPDNTMLYVALAGAAFYFLTMKK